MGSDYWPHSWTLCLDFALMPVCRNGQEINGNVQTSISAGKKGITMVKSKGAIVEVLSSMFHIP